MRRSVQIATCIAVLLAVRTTPTAQSNAAVSSVRDASAVPVRGVATDPSGAVLPGVTVTASREGRDLETTVTSATGEFSFVRLPEGAVDLLLHLDGFDDARTRVIVPAVAAKPGDEVRVVQRMELRGRTEAVTVHAEPVIVAPPVVRAVLEPVPEHDQESVCGPALAEGLIQSSGTIRAPRSETVQGLFTSGDELLIDTGLTPGVRVGQNFVVRRRYDTALTDKRGVHVQGEHSSGLLQIVSMDSATAVAAVVYACDAMMTGDYLVPFVPAAVPETPAASALTIDNPARLLFGDAGELLGVARRKLVIDRGTRQGVQPGQRLTLMRKSKFRGTKPTVVGEAVVVAVRQYTATIRVEWATDVIYFGEDGDVAVPAAPVSSIR